MSTPNTAGREEWVAARLELYAREGEFVRAKEDLSARRRALPWVRVATEYVFEAAEGKRTLAELFDGRRQLIVYHFMVPPETGRFCPSCSFWIDNVGHPAHLHARDTTLVVDCPVPYERLRAFGERMGWTVPLVSSVETTFYGDFFVDLGADGWIQPGVSTFIAQDGDVFHTYSSLQTGGEFLNSTYHYLDMTALGRQEDGLGFKHEWVRYHDEYGT